MDKLVFKQANVIATTTLLIIKLFENSKFFIYAYLKQISN